MANILPDICRYLILPNFLSDERDDSHKKAYQQYEVDRLGESISKE